MVILVILLLFSCTLCKSQTCESTRILNTRISKESFSQGAVLLNSSSLSLEDCLTYCCSNDKCTTLAYSNSNEKCILYDCGVPDACIRKKSTTYNLFESVKLPDEVATHPFWSHLMKQSKKQKALTIAVFVAIILIFFSGLIAFIYFYCRRGKLRRRGQAKLGSRRARGVGGSYRILFNAEAEEPLAGGNNSLF